MSKGLSISRINASGHGRRKTLYLYIYVSDFTLLSTFTVIEILIFCFYAIITRQEISRKILLCKYVFISYIFENDCNNDMKYSGPDLRWDLQDSCLGASFLVGPHVSNQNFH